MPQPDVGVLFVCLGNICRSPTAEGVFRDRLRKSGLEGRVAVDSAGTGTWHLGEAPDPRAQAAARRRGIDISGQTARRLESRDFQRFDYILVMDRMNLEAISEAFPDHGHRNVRLFLEFAPDSDVAEVPDPFHGAEDGFETVIDLVEKAADGLIDHIRTHHLAEQSP